MGGDRQIAIENEVQIQIESDQMRQRKTNPAIQLWTTYTFRRCPRADLRVPSAQIWAVGGNVGYECESRGLASCSATR